ncbi:MAG TPA: hypothetical protein VLF62_05870, partial [Candidatus Saccharimonadales bacterium]|nr:hypothetical protein [Candidatus Saccharimonadales bacterium]
MNDFWGTGQEGVNWGPGGPGSESYPAQPWGFGDAGPQDEGTFRAMMDADVVWRMQVETEAAQARAAVAWDGLEDDLGRRPVDMPDEPLARPASTAEISAALGQDPFNTSADRTVVSDAPSWRDEARRLKAARPPLGRVVHSLPTEDGTRSVPVIMPNPLAVGHRLQTPAHDTPVAPRPAVVPEVAAAAAGPDRKVRIAAIASAAALGIT